MCRPLVCLQRRMREMRKAYDTAGVLGPLRDQRPHQCNVDDELRMAALPKEAGMGVCYRDLPGVVTNPDSELDGTAMIDPWRHGAESAPRQAVCTLLGEHSVQRAIAVQLRDPTVRRVWYNLHVL